MDLRKRNLKASIHYFDCSTCDFESHENNETDQDQVV